MLGPNGWKGQLRKPNLDSASLMDSRETKLPGGGTLDAGLVLTTGRGLNAPLGGR